jgi:hypothetical protein
LGVGLAFAVFPVFAEIFAIRVAIRGEPSRFETWVVVAAVVFGTLAIGISLLWPWLRVVGTRGAVLGAAVLPPIIISFVLLLSSDVTESARLDCLEHIRRDQDRAIAVLQYAAIVEKDKPSKEAFDFWRRSIIKFVRDENACLTL